MTDQILSRGFIYDTFAMGLQPCTPKTAAELLSEKTRSALPPLATLVTPEAGEDGSGFATDVTGWVQTFDTMNPGKLAAAHARLFGHTARGVVCPYETEFGQEGEFQQPRQLGKINGFYNTFGLGVRREERERPDHVLWDTWISGRLARRGRADPTIRAKRWSQFSKTFAFMGSDAEARFASLYASERQTHHALVDLAANPANCRERPDGQPQAQPCPLCRFPSYNLVPGAGLDSAVLDEIAADHPGWRPEGRLCDQCADLYRAREMSRTAASMLPGSVE